MDNSEVLDLMDNSLSCQNLAPFAKKTYAATGALVEGVPLICGGYASGYSDECYQITKSMTSLVTNMKSKRYGAASVVLDNNQLWVMGGGDGSNILKSTEYIQIDAGSTSGPDLPLAVEGHAIVAWTSSSFMLIGGNDGDKSYLAKTFHYHVEKPDEWIPGPELKQARYWHAAGLGMDRATNDPYIAVTGGVYKYGTVGWNLDSVELLYEGETEWQAGKHQ